MKSIRILQVGALLAAVATAQTATVESRGAASISQVAAFGDSTEEAMEHLKDTSQSGDLERTRAALTVYLRSLSEYHMRLASLRPERQEKTFLKALAPRLTSQLGETKALAESAQPGLSVALNEAMNHLRSALDLVDHTVNMKRGPSLKISIRGPESEKPDTRWPPYLLFRGAGPEFRMH